VRARAVRILTVANHLGARGGLERTQLTNCRALADRRHRIDLVYVTAGDFAEQWRRFATTMVAVASTLPRRRHPVSSTLDVGTAIRRGRRLAPDALYVYRYWDVPYAVTVGALAKAPTVMHLCLPPPRVVPWWLRRFLRRVDAVVSVSHDTLRRWEGTGLPADGAQVALTGIDLDEYRPASAAERETTRRAFELEPDAFLVLYAGRIGREKGVDVLVRAFREVASRVPGSRLVVVGSPSLGADPTDSARYVDELRELGRGLPVTWFEAQRDVRPLIQCADVAVVPSLWPEPLPRAVLEPLACGVPVVASRVGGNPEVMSGWLASHLVDPGNPGALATQLEALSTWRTKEPSLGARCRAEAEQRFNLETETDMVEGVLHAALAGRQDAARRWRRSSPTEAKSCG
jgi:glycosyltransferase involved in cell wall biosynthesis